MTEQGSNRLEVNRSGGCRDCPQRDCAVCATGDERARIRKAGVGKLADVKVLKMAKDLMHR